MLNDASGPDIVLCNGDILGVVRGGQWLGGVVG